jgi:SAM-dependent methyltransferase
MNRTTIKTKAEAALTSPTAHRARHKLRRAATRADERLRPLQVRQVGVFVELIGRRQPPPGFDPGTPMTDLIEARMADGDRETLLGLLSGSSQELYDYTYEDSRRRLLLNLAAANGPDEILARLGLVRDEPPEDVHAMARGWLAAGGDTYLADMVIAAVQQAGGSLPDGGTILDFGGSSGRVLRVIAAARPDARAIGCDPNEGAIAWASEHLPGEYFVSPQAPPLDLADASVDVAYAISIWSHFAAGAAVQWLEEMARVVKPGGSLLITTHGWDTLATQHRRGDFSPGKLSEVAQGLVLTGHAFLDVFGEAGDWGVKDPQWGNGYMTLDWLVAQTVRDWDLATYWPGHVDQVQDVIVLRRR